MKTIEPKHYKSRFICRQYQCFTEYSVPDGILLAGELPPNKHKLVVAWIEIHKKNLLADWELTVNGRKPFTIKGLDQ